MPDMLLLLLLDAVAHDGERHWVPTEMFFFSPSCNQSRDSRSPTKSAKRDNTEGHRGSHCHHIDSESQCSHVFDISSRVTSEPLLVSDSSPPSPTMPAERAGVRALVSILLSLLISALVYRHYVPH